MVGGTLGLIGLLVGSFFVGQYLGTRNDPEVLAVVEPELHEQPIVFPSLTGGPQSPGGVGMGRIARGRVPGVF